MTNYDTVRGMDNPSVVGPPNDPPSHIMPIPPVDQFNRGVLPVGDPDATSLRYFIETESSDLADIITRLDDEPEEEA